MPGIGLGVGLGVGGVTAAPFHPASLSGALVSLSALEGVTKNESDIVTAWADNRVSGKSFTPQGAATPEYETGVQNGNPGIKVTNLPAEPLEAELDSAPGANFSLFAAVRLDPAYAAQDMQMVSWGGVSSAGSGGYMLRYSGAGKLRVQVEGGAVLHTGTASLTAGSAHLLEGHYNGTTCELFIDSVADGSSLATASTSGDWCQVGGRTTAARGLYGWMLCIYLFNRSLDAGERTQVRNFINL